MKRFLSLLAVAALVGAGVWAYLYTQSIGNAPKYRLARVEHGPLTAAVSATGNLNAVITVQVGSQVSGQIKDLLVDFNSVVKKAQVIARIDPEIFQAKVNQAKADLDSASATVLNQQAQIERTRADVENARAAHAEAKAQTAKAQVAVVDTRRDYERKTELFGRQLIAKSDLDSSQAAHDSAVAQLESARAHDQALASAILSATAQLRVAEAMLASAQAQVEQKIAALKQSQLDLDHTTITAPVDGVVVSRQVDVGRINVDERATFTVDAFPGETFVGSVTQIRKAAQIVQNVVTYTVVVAVPNPRGRLLPGMTANVKLVVAQKPSALKVPNAALRFRPAGVDVAAPGSPGGGVAPGATPPSSEQIGDRLVKELTLSEDQQQKLEPILSDSRQQLAALQGLPEPDRRAKAQKVREVARLRIREILTD